MIDPTTGSVGWPSSNRSVPNRTGPVPSAGETGPVFPRSGWSDAASLSTRAQDALSRLHNDYSGVSNWRWRSDTTTIRPGLPEMAAMYGLAYPPTSTNWPQPKTPVRPPDMAAMYGLAYPPTTTGWPDTNPPVRPPDMAAMYGLAYPPTTTTWPQQPSTPVRPPDMAAMYGLAYPPTTTTWPQPSTPVRPPDMAAMYGLAYPNS